MGFNLTIKDNYVSDVSIIQEDGNIDDVTYCIVKSALEDGFSIKCEQQQESYFYADFTYYKDRNPTPVNIYLVNTSTNPINGFKPLTGLSIKQSNEFFNLSFYTYCTKDVFNSLETAKEKFYNQHIYIEEDKRAITDINEIKYIDDITAQFQSTTNELPNNLDYEFVSNIISHINSKLFGTMPMFNTIFDIHNMIKDNNLLIKEGIVVTDDNIEDKQREVLEKNNEVLTNAFTSFVNIMNKYKYMKSLFKEYEDINKLIRSSEVTKEELNDAVNNFDKIYKEYEENRI